MATLVVVYAAFGDCLLLRTTPDKDGKRQNWLIDGGPTSLSPKIPPNPTKIPSYHYLKETLKTLCSTDGKVKLDGIIVSHTDSDHVQGVIQILRDWLHTDVQVDDGRLLHLDGPVIMNAEFFVDKHDKLPKLLASKGFQASKIDPIPNISQFSHLGLFQMKRRDGIIVPAKWPPLDKKELSDAGSLALHYVPPTESNSKHNIASIITIATKTDIDGVERLNIVSTGDGMASLIDEAMKKVTKETTPTFEVFKVPHHGSERNNQMGKDWLTSKDFDIPKTQDLFLAMNYGIQKELANQNRSDDEQGAFDKGKECYDRCKWQWEEKAAEKVATYLHKFDDYFDGIVKSFESAVNNIATHGPPGNMGNLGTPQTLQAVCAAFQKPNEMGPPAFTFSPAFSIVGCQKYIVENFGVTRTTKALLALIYDESDWTTFRKTLRVYKFYSTFLARNYVISANGSHGHPSPSTVAGIVLAILVAHRSDPKWTANIIVTDGRSIQRRFVRYIVEHVLPEVLPEGVDTIPMKDWSKAYTIYFLRSRHYAEITYPLDNETKKSMGTLPLEWQDEPNYLQDLHNQFEKLVGPNIPHLVDPEEKTFHIELSLNKKPPERIGWLDVYSSPGPKGPKYGLKVVPDATNLHYLNSVVGPWIDEKYLPGGPWRAFKKDDLRVGPSRLESLPKSGNTPQYYTVQNLANDELAYDTTQQLLEFKRTSSVDSGGQWSKVLLEFKPGT